MNPPKDAVLRGDDRHLDIGRHGGALDLLQPGSSGLERSLRQPYGFLSVFPGTNAAHTITE